MHRIDGPGATIDGQFTEGDPTQGVPATTVTGAWLNAVQEEIATVVEDAGLEMDKPDNGQLSAAITAIVNAAVAAALAGLPEPEIGWSTGDVKLTMKAAADAGWVLCNDGTIGPSGSGATARANADCAALFALLWDNVSNTYAPVSTGRGASAAADWAAGKTIALTKVLGRGLAISGSGSGLTARTLGQTVGAETHTLTEAQMPLHGHPTRVARADMGGSTLGGGLIDGAAGTLVNLPAWSGATSDTEGRQIGGTGGGAAYPIMQPTAFLNAMVKL